MGWKYDHHCPVCDLKFPSAKQATLHVVLVHLPLVNGTRCWCGLVLCGPQAWPRSPTVARQQADILLRHWTLHGGMQAHYTAALLGID